MSILESDLISWKNPMLTGAVLAGGNFVILSLVFDLPIIALFLTYGIFILMFVGGCGRLLQTKVEHVSLSVMLPREQFLVIMGSCYETMERLIEMAVPIFLWQNFQISFAFLAAAYLTSSILVYVGIEILVFIVFNALFVYGKFRNEVDSAIYPYFQLACDKVSMVWTMIPRWTPESESSETSRDSSGGKKKK